MKRALHVTIGFLWALLLAGTSLAGCTQAATTPKNADKALTAFSFATPAATGVITESDRTIRVTVPWGTDLTALTPTVTIKGASVAPASGTAQNFTAPVVYAVKAEDGTTANYTVTVEAKNLVGLVTPYEDNSIWASSKAAFFKEIASKTTAEFAPCGGSSEAELAAVQTMISHGMKVLLIAPWDSSTCTAIPAAKTAGVTVICYGRIMSKTKAIDYYVDFDNIAVGEKQGQFLVDKALAEGKKGLPLYLYAGSLSDHNSYDFFRGAWTKLQPKIADGTFVLKNSSEAEALKTSNTLTDAQITQIATPIDTGWNPTTAASLATANIKANPPSATDNVYLLCPNDGTSLAICNAFNDKGVAYSRQYSTGQDAVKDSIIALYNGRQSMTILKDIRLMASASAIMAQTCLSGAVPATTKTVNNGSKDISAHLLPGQLVEKATIKSLIIDSGYYTAADFPGITF